MNLQQQHLFPDTPTKQDNLQFPAVPAYKVYGSLGVAAIRNGQAGAFRLWTWARNQDNGRGCIPKTELFKVPQKSRAIIYRWHQQALSLGLLWEIKGRVHYANVGKAAVIFGQKVCRAVEVTGLFGLEWKAVVWAAYIAGEFREDVTISRKNLRKLTGIHERTQARYDKRLRKEQQFLVEEILDKTLDNHQKMQAAKDVDWAAWSTGNWIVKPLPNTYHHSLTVCNVGQTVSANKYLKRHAGNNLLKKLASVSNTRKIFYPDKKTAQEKMKKKTAHVDGQPAAFTDDVKPVLVKSHKNIWRVMRPWSEVTT